MAITVRWGDSSQTIICYEYVGRWSWAEYQGANDQAVTLARMVDCDIDIIADFRQSFFLPESAMSSFRKSLATSRLKFNVAVLIFENEFFHRLYGVFRRVYARQSENILIAHSLEEAVEKITTRRAQLGSAITAIS